MQQNVLTSKLYFRSLTIIFSALLAGQVFFTLLTLLLGEIVSGKEDMSSLIDIFKYFMPFCVLGGIIASIIISKAKLKEARKRDTLKQKLEDYQTLTIVKLAILEGQAFFAIVVFMITGSLIFLGYGLIVTLFFLTQFPMKIKIVEELNLNESDKRLLENPVYTIQ